VKILITGGGSAGHVTPLIAIAAELKKRHPQAVIKYIGQYGDSMRSLTQEASAINHCYRILAGKWRRYHGVGWVDHLLDFKTLLKNLRDGLFFGIGLMQSFGILLFWHPKVVFVKGGYVGLPVGLAAVLLRIPIVTHDSDAVPGLTNKLLSRFAKALAVGLPPEAYRNYYPMSKLHFTGVPIRPEFFLKLDEQANALKESLGFDNQNIVITILGGSLGAIRLNEAVFSSLKELLADPQRRLIWVTGSRQYEDIKQRLKSLPAFSKRLQIMDFVTEMPKFMAASDVLISRAGATTIAELAALAKPIILVPNQFLTNGHQLKNAALLEAEQAAIVIQEPALAQHPQLLAEAVDKILGDNKLAALLGQNLHKLAVTDATARIVDVIEGAL
jgi:UDP-N-acetylglucosamine--N-acetylmuramyl-(pentapeptide) pyrophosphoryl-undecaprenol N-acetylglucosamine transferase